MTPKTSLKLRTVRNIQRKRGTQARRTCAPYVARVEDKNSMLYWLAQAAKDARLAKGRRQSHIAAEISRDQSMIARFEHSIAWSSNTEKIVNAYAADLDIDRFEFWQEAVRRWEESKGTAAKSDAPASALRARPPAASPPSIPGETGRRLQAKKPKPGDPDTSRSPRGKGARKDTG